MAATQASTGQDVRSKELLTWATAALDAAGIESARLDAELLLAHCLGCERARLLAHPDQTLAPEQAGAFTALVQRRLNREPLAYLTGRRWFFGREFEVTPAVLIPRPETELLVETALAWLAARPQQNLRLIDVGAGSGAIAITLSAECGPHIRIYASDLSGPALEVARANARRHGCAGRIRFLHGDLLDPLPEAVDLILANLPYVAETERDQLMPEVRDYEPEIALFSGGDGLALIDRLLEQAPVWLRPGGALLLEIGYNQGAAARTLARRRFAQASITLRPDLGGHDRLLVIQT